MRRSIVVAIAVLAAAGAAAGVTASVMRTSESSGTSRVERFLRDASTGGSCDFDACGILPPATVHYTTPTSVETVDVTVTITFQYRTSRGHPAFAGLSVNDGTSRMALKPRRSYPLAPAADETTTTLTWFEKDLPAAGKEYTFELGVAPPFVQGRSFVSARKLTVVIESWTAGD
jgi:hypothetical protein